MELEIITRHFTLGDEQRDAVTEALEKVERFSPRPIQSLRLTLTHESGVINGDAVLHLKNADFRAEAGGSTEPPLVAAEIAETLRKQLVKFKGKVSARQRGEEGGLGRAMIDGGGVFGAGEEAAEGFILKDMAVDAAKSAFAEAELPFFIFRNVDNSRLSVIYRDKDGELGHLESQEPEAGA
ncbi:MAG: HPF/RaiA family ribosome-associated protein [bacterium]|nr:HPF/RaiA family ribosome-associated protein [bacterium]